MKAKRLFKIMSIGVAIILASQGAFTAIPSLAYNSAVPRVTNIQQVNGNVQLSWDTPIPNSDVFLVEDLNSYYLDASYSSTGGYFVGVTPYGNGWLYDRYGNIRSQSDVVRNSLKIIDGVGVDSSRGILWTRTLPNNGWWYHRSVGMSGNYPLDTDIYSMSEVGIQQYLKMNLNRNIIVRVQAKGNGDFLAGFNPGHVGRSIPYYNITWAETLSESEYLYRLKNKIPIKINNPNGYTDGNVNHATALRDTYDYSFNLSRGYLDNINGQWYFFSNNYSTTWSSSRPEEVVSPIRYVTAPISGQPFAIAEHGQVYNAFFNEINAPNWEHFSANTNILNNAQSQAIKGQYLVYLAGRTSTNLYVDNLQFAYAPLSRVYKNGTLVKEDYTVEYVDTEATDRNAPSMPTGIVADTSGNYVDLSWSASTDYGTTYNYQISSVNANGEESAKSSSVSTEIKTGVSKYRIYKNGQFLKDVVGTSTVIAKSELSGLTIVAIDGAGNTSSPNTIPGIMNLTVTPNITENLNELKWNNPFNSQSSYRIYRKNSNGVWESIPSKATVKVLNVYPDGVGIRNTGLSGGQIDLDGKSVHDSGILKTWLLKENISDIQIETVSLSSFNDNPEKYLKKTNGIWSYDAVFYGMWNLLPEYVYPNDSAVEYLRTFINDGGGFMTSHHTIGYKALDRGINKLAKEMGVEIFSNQPYTACPIYSGRDSSGKLYPTVSFEVLEDIACDYSSYWPYSSQVQIVKKGLLTEYPFKVGEIGDVISIPTQHGLNIFAKGEVWMKPYNATGYPSGTLKKLSVSPATGENGTNNFFVHTYSNTAIINSGHSFPNISQAETRIIANTLYYLSQITNETKWKDRIGMDTEAPNKPTISVTPFGEKIRATFSSTDKGVSSEYKVVARNNGNEVVSNIASTTNTSGIYGYSILVDNNPSSIPDEIIDTTSSSYEYVVDHTKPVYVHVRAVDNAGNVSEVAHYKYQDTTAPTATHSISPTAWTNGSVTINVIATDTGTGIKRIKTPDGNYIGSSNLNYVVNANDNYTFVVEDYAGNTLNYVVVISNIDKINPTTPTITTNSAWTNAVSVPVSISGATDSGSGLNRIEYMLSGATIKSWATYVSAFNVVNEGITTIKARAIDNVGNTSKEATSQVKIDRTTPHSTSIVINSNQVYTNNRVVNITLKASDTASGVSTMQFRNESGSWSQEEAYSTSKSWTLSTGDGVRTVGARFKDVAGNWSPEVKDTIVLDTTAPVLGEFIIQGGRAYYNSNTANITFKATDNFSGIREMYVSNDNATWATMPYTESFSWNLTTGDGTKTVYIKLVDVAGNISAVISRSIVIDKVKPTGTLVISNGNEQTMSRDVKLTLKFADDRSGVEIIKIQEDGSEYVFPSTPTSPTTIDWRLSQGTGLKIVHMVLVDRAGNMSDPINDSIVVDKVAIEKYVITNIVNPTVFNKTNPFKAKAWVFEPQPMVAGGNFSFAVTLKEPYDASVVEDKAVYKVQIVGANGYDKVITGIMDRQSAVNYTATVTVPEDTPKGAKVFTVVTASRELMVSPFDKQIVYFPGEEATTKAQIGEISGNIFEQIKFNEIR